MKIDKLLKLSFLVLSVTLTVTLAQTCSISATWRDPAPNPNGPVSPSVITANPAKTLTFNTPIQWQAWTEFGNSGAFSTATGSSNGVSVAGAINFTTFDWYPSTQFLVQRDTIPYLRGGVEHTFNFTFLSGQAPDFGNTLANVTFMLVPLFDTGVDVGDRYLSGFDSVYYQHTFTGNLAQTTQWMALSHKFTPASDILSSILVVRWIFTTSVVKYNWFIKSSLLAYPEYPITIAPLLPSYSELVTIPNQPTTTVPQSLSSCPHNQTGLKHWHNPAIWPNGVMPSPTSTITLPANSKVLISSCSINSNVIYSKIVIPATSQLIFSDANITVRVKDIVVQGQLWIGSSTCRMNGNITLIFHGAKSTANTLGTGVGTKGIYVPTGGFASIHGKQYTPTWSRLAQTAFPGDYVIALQSPVNWEVGQKVVITTSRIEDDFTLENEVLTIAAVNGRVVQFTTPLKFYHYAGLEYQVEVGLLSRRINLQSHAPDTTGSFGGHVLITGEAQLAGVAGTRMGQQNIIGRYPFHFHMAKTVKKSYITDCSVVSSFYRCYTIHATNNLTVSNNVAYDASGHCYYIEDGVEENNTLSYNLAAFIHYILAPANGYGQSGEYYAAQTGLAQPADITASGFYITNCYNTFIGNAASGGWGGFSIPNLIKPIGPSRTVNIAPHERPFIKFEGNTAHSTGYYWPFGSCIYVGGRLWEDPDQANLLQYVSGRNERDTLDTYGTGQATFLRFNNTKTFLTTGQAVSHWGYRVEVHTYEGHDVGRAGSLFGMAWLNNAIVNGKSGNPFAQGTKYHRQGFMMYDTLVMTLLTNINFRNYEHNPKAEFIDEDNVVFISLTHTDIYKPQGISAVRNITYTNVNPTQIMGHFVQNTGSSRFFNYIDWDGSTTLNYPNKTLVGSHSNWWNHDENCSFNRYGLGVWICSPKRPEVEIAAMDVLIDGLLEYINDGFPPENYIGTYYLFGHGITDRRSMPVTQNPGITGVSNMGWYLYVNQGSPAKHKINVFQVTSGHWVLYSMSFPAGTTFDVRTVHPWEDVYNRTVTPVTSLDQVINGDGTKYYFDQTHLFVKIIDFTITDPLRKEFTRSGATVYDTNLPFSYFDQLSYHITANCPASTIVNYPYGNFCQVPDVLPYY
ncbi:hypothetical protein SAMD00019534_080520 [Acytostelium subglobosum LB1]|uniref:hypothetical protein n=1 Tax=Acytostelium subglobosum LB1 TaxID=1410327 RepID=UPI0006449716|nr:hypothetical protein SAMD00019534_080520 [Acytostelium subglobosum LB1]GAM24877.1 hypothetical protein SAMD00019534_080520 [Acytostelium subglobosum LB1]|eukprot:XP_012751966.1 hypothetical protein SAMD00019534_080520 [Acytostelium subglobosum LB1]